MGRKLLLELYEENGTYGVYISDDIGGSGIDVKGETPQEVCENAVPYMVDYFEQ